MKIKILCVGCLHGKIPKNFDRRIKKNKPDLILGSGDYAGINLRQPLAVFERKIIEKYGTEFSSWPKKIQMKFDSIETDAQENGLKVLNYVSKLNIPFYFVHGNWDQVLKKYTGTQFVVKRQKNMFFVHNKVKKFKNIFILGYGGYRVTSMKEYLYNDLPQQFVDLAEILIFRRKMTEDLEKLFKKVEAVNTIFLTHDPPYKTLDYLKSEKKFYGEKISRRIIEKYQPLLCICSHFHEHQGIMKIGRTIVINSGFGHNGQAALVEIENGKAKTKLIKL